MRMRMPFEKLMELVAGLSDEDMRMTLGQLGDLWDEDASRIADAIDAVRVTRGELTYISFADEAEVRYLQVPADEELLSRPAFFVDDPMPTETDTDHYFVSKPYTKTCFYRLQDYGGRCENLEDCTVHRGTPAYQRVHDAH